MYFQAYYLQRAAHLEASAKKASSITLRDGFLRAAQQYRDLAQAEVQYGPQSQEVQAGSEEPQLENLQQSYEVWRIRSRRES